MQVEVVPLTSFIHGPINAHEGRTLKMESALAGDLERAGLVRIRMAPPASAPVKTADDGPGQPSSASLAAQASHPAMSSSSRLGASKIRKTDT